MMPTLLRPWKRLLHGETPDPHATPDAAVAAAPPEEGRLFLLRAQGGLSYRISRFDSVEAANEYLRHNVLEARGGLIAFWGMEEPPGEGDAEPVVMIQDPSRPGIAQLYSFVDMETASEFYREEAAKGALDPDGAMLYWAVPVRLEAPSLLDARAAPSPAVPVPVRAPAPVRELRPATALAGSGFSATASAAPQRGPATEERPSLAPRGPGLVERIQAWPGWDGLAPILARALFLNEEVFEDVRRDPNAMGRAKLILGSALVATALGAAGMGVASIVAHVPAAVAGWIAYVFTVYFLGTRVFAGARDEGTFAGLLPILGLATAPAILLALGAVPVYGPLLVLVANIWVMLTTTTALGPALRLDRQSAMVTATAGCLLMFAIAQVLPVVVV